MAARVASTEGGAERDVAVPIHRRDLNHSHVAWEYLLSIKCLSLTKEDGNIVGPASLHIFAHIGTHEERLGEEHAVETFLSVGGVALSVEMMDTDVLQLAVFATATECVG